MLQYELEDIMADPKPLKEILQKYGGKVFTKRASGRLYASEVGHCERKAAISATQNGIAKHGADFSLYVKIGDAVEKVVNNSFERKGILLFEGYRLEAMKNVMGGVVDSIVLLERPNGTYKIEVIEVKSCGNLPSEPKVEHLGQAKLYSAIVGFPCAIFYVSREVADWTGDVIAEEFHYKFDPEDLSRYVWRAYYSAACIREGVLPEQPFFKYKKDCGYCDHKDFCWNDQDEESTEKYLSNQKTKLKPLTQELHEQLVAETNEFVEEFMSEEQIARRRHGVLNHIINNGKNKKANALLDSMVWDDLHLP